MVEVKSLDEISATLDINGTYKGLYFMPNMAEFCGGKFDVFKVLRIIRLEKGETRASKSPSVILKGVYCDGKNYDGCERSCFLIWKEAWLKKISEK